jgi:hypothetical protein
MIYVRHRKPIQHNQSVTIVAGERRLRTDPFVIRGLVISTPRSSHRGIIVGVLLTVCSFESPTYSRSRTS